MARRRFTRDRQGRFHPRLDRAEQELLMDLPRQAQDLILAEDPATRRLFPVAYPEHPEAQAEFAAMMAEGLQDRHQHALDTLAVTASADSLDEADMHQWMAALEALRLILGTQLDVAEDMDSIDPLDPRAGQYALYVYLSVLQGEIVEVLTAALPAAVDEGSGS